MRWKHNAVQLYCDVLMFLPSLLFVVVCMGEVLVTVAVMRRGSKSVLHLYREGLPPTFQFYFPVRYRLYNRRMNFAQARKFCRQRRGRLALILNSRQNAAVLRLLRGKRQGRQLYWIGLNDIKRERRWVWNNGLRMRWK